MILVLHSLHGLCGRCEHVSNCSAVAAFQHRPVICAACSTFAESECLCWYPKDGELCLGQMKPEETLVEVCSDSDVQIDRQT